jgi:hypothetical protein
VVGADMKFKVGDKVRIIQDCSYLCVAEVYGGLGMEGEVVSITYSINVWSSKFTNESKTWSFKEENLELRDNVSVAVTPITHVNHCPRCNGELYEKKTEYCGIVIKCKKCGWC